ncbi:MAG: M50 family metallopeptidase, partial [Caldilineaceae bacterium]|nr:M50 family metallopeptidase [Caldilineaceae bacterium]
MELILAEDILAKQQKHQRTVRRATRILYGVFLLAFAAVVTALFFFAQIEPPFGTAPATAIFPLLLACYLIMLSATLVTIAIHEFGHLVAAWMVNYYVALILIGPFALARTNTGWRWRVGTNGKLGGAVLAGPLDAHDLRRRHLWVIAGGPLASWLWYILLLVLSWTLQQPPGLHWPRLILDGFVLWAGLACWLNLLPYQIGHIPNDSWQLLALWRKDPQFLLHLRLNWLATQSLAGARPRALDSTTLDELTEKLAPKRGAAQAAVVAFYQALDSGDHEAATGYLHKALGATAPTPTPHLLLAVSYYHATFAKDAVQARRWLDYYDACFGDVPNSFSALIATELHQSYTHVEATIRQLAGDHIGARRAARQSLQLLANSIERGDAQWLTPQLQALLGEPAIATASPEEQHPPTGRRLSNPLEPCQITRARQVFSPGAML